MASAATNCKSCENLLLSFTRILSSGDFLKGAAHAPSLQMLLWYLSHFSWKIFTPGSYLHDIFIEDAHTLKQKEILLTITPEGKFRYFSILYKFITLNKQ